MEWEVVIGLETHAQLTTASKIFSGASTAFGAPPNTQASAVDLAMPGTLPVLNKAAVERAIRFGLAVGGNIAPSSVLARKNYFYPDLPKGYQISQYEQPVVSGGTVAFVLGDEERRVRLTRAHLEEDAGKLLHESFHGMTGVDLNRAGTALLEIVSEPDIRCAAEAVAYAKALHALVRWIGICDGNMQEGSFRCDANVSVRRQVELIEDGGKVVQETRLFDPDRGETRPMRSKEDAQDYRYFPDPDLLPLEIARSWIEGVGLTMPSLPAARRRKYRDEFGLSAYDANLLTESREKSDFYEETLAAVSQPRETRKLVAHWVTGDVSALLNERGVDFDAAPVSPGQVASLLDRVHDATISAKAAKEVLIAMAKGEGEPDAIIETRGLKQISDAGALESAVDKVIAGQAKFVEDYRAGKEKAFNALVGQVMKATGGKANPAQVSEILRRKLSAG
jgi:aspartyl-tRNA(Asn)/glutamyl-tRNA(Gln) amidotransferase subunit B